MTQYPRFFEYDNRLVKITLENDELAGYDSFGKPFDGIGRALQDGKELTEKEYNQKLRENRSSSPVEQKIVRTWDDLIKEKAE